LASDGTRLTLILLKIIQVVEKLKWKITAEDLLNLLPFSLLKKKSKAN